MEDFNHSCMPQDHPLNDSPSGIGSPMVTSSRFLEEQKKPQDLRNHSCSLGGKSFISGKALGGHTSSAHVHQMTSQNYPNFPDFGVDPAESSKAPMECPDLNREIQTLLKTGKRGRPQVSKPTSSLEEEEEDAFDALIMLHGGDPRPSQTSHNQDNESSSSSSSKKKHQKLLESAGETLDEGDEGPILVSSPTNPNQIQMNKPPAAPQPSPYLHFCIYCNRSFPTYLALGGHNSIQCMKMKILNTSGINGVTMDHDDESRMIHRCQECNKSFRCGQALGGHMRAHSRKDNKSERSNEVRRGMGFDLNGMPEQQRR